MSVLVKGMKMPENCIMCPFAERVPPGRTRCLITCQFLADGYNAPSPERNEFCPLVALPDQHGRLIDADALHYNRIRIAHNDGTVGGYNAVVMSAEIKDAQTIIESEEGE